jgi:hypothetical protein
MKYRCYRTKHSEFHRYGGRGITICDEWLGSPQAFFDWAVANGYRDDLSIDRIDNDKGYSPDNCRWATRKEQQNNCSNSVKVEIDGVVKTLRQWSEEKGIYFNTLYKRYKKGIIGADLIKEVQICKSHHKMKKNAF